MYQIFDILVRSELPLSGLTRTEDRDCDWSISLPIGPIDEKSYVQTHEWMTRGVDDTPTVLMASATNGKHYLLKFPGLADFQIDFELRMIYCFAADGQTKATLVHLLQDQVIPRILSHQGRPVVHASSVLLPDGHAIAFLGSTGWGKSTLASGFYNAGLPVLSDDCFLLKWDLDNRCLMGVAAYPSLRLWPDTVEHSFPGSVDFSDVSGFSDKKQRFLESVAGGRPVPVSAMFILDDPHQVPKRESIKIAPAGGNEAAIALVSSVFALDASDLSFAKRNFRWAGDLIRSHAPIFILDFPRDYLMLESVVGRVLEYMDADYCGLANGNEPVKLNEN
jgi:hypothetical protein